jgi:hypothetical protein
MYKNIEGYPDPTAGIAMARVRREEKLINKKNRQNTDKTFIKWVYIASPYKGDTILNSIRAKRYARFVARQCCVPVAPHIYMTQFLDDNDKAEREAGLFLGLQMLKRCNELWIFGSTISDGMQREIDFAKKRNIPIRYFDNMCEEVWKK